jgi:hypothetical protein
MEVRGVKQGEVMIKTPATSLESMPMFQVIDLYDSFFKLGLTHGEKSDLITYLLGPVAPFSNCAYEPQAGEEPINPAGSS